mmetsp:Transcript_1741/g.2333  ORF Transcript_1741/g.2333 Transcript_1741/m.2333 type:complete len:160 (+) Transcript_1741:118-597(+)
MASWTSISSKSSPPKGNSNNKNNDQQDIFGYNDCDYGTEQKSINKTSRSGMNNDPNKHKSSSFRGGVIGGAAVAGGTIGMLVWGPITAVVTGIGAAVAATTNTKAGAVARASGEATASVGSSVKKFDENYKVTQKSSSAIMGSARWITSKYNGLKDEKK